MLRRSLGLLVVLLFVAAVAAEEPSAPEPAAEQERSFPESWAEFSAQVEQPAASRELLDEVPNRFRVLRDQWSTGLPPDVVEARDSDEYYGRLGPEGRREELTLQECIALALQYNTQLEVQRLNPTAAAAGVRRAWSVFDPALYAGVSKTYVNTPATNLLAAGAVTDTSGDGGGAGTVPTPIPTPDFRLRNQYNREIAGSVGMRKTLLSGGNVALDWTNSRTVANPSVIAPLVPTYRTGLGLSLNQPLLRDFGWQYALLLVRVAQNTEAAAYQEYRAAIANIVAEVETRYWRLALAIQSVKVQEQSLELANELLRENEGKFNVGTLPRTAVLEAQSRVAQREATLISAVNAREIGRDNLRALINYRDPGDTALLIVDPGDKPTAVDYDIDMRRSLDTALRLRPELAAARLTVEGRGLTRKIAQNQLLPRFDFVGGVGLNGLSGRDARADFAGQPVPVNRNLDGGYGDSLDLMADGRFYSYTAGAVLEVPLDNARAKADYSAANVGFEQARLSLRQLEESVTLEIKTAINNLESGLKSIEATRIARELAEENLRNQQARYDVGLATTKDILDFQDQLTLARFREIEALTSYNSDVANMRRVEGTLLSARNVLVEPLASEGTPWWAHF